MLACTWVAEMKVVGKAAPSKMMTEALVNPLPLIVSVNAVFAAAMAGLKLESVGGAGITV